MDAANAEIIISVILIIFGLVIICMGWLMLRVAGQLIRGEISRKNYMGRGIKIKEAFASDEAWSRINREGGKVLIFSSLAFIAMGIAIVLWPFIMPITRGSIMVLFAIMFVCLLIVVVPPIGYAIWVKRTEPKRKAT